MVGYAFMMLFPRLGIGFFTSDSALIGSSVRILRIMVMFIPLAAVQITGAIYFQALGKATEALVLGLSQQFFILIPSSCCCPGSSASTASGCLTNWQTSYPPA